MPYHRRDLLRLGAGALAAMPFIGRHARADEPVILLRDLYEKNMSFSPLALAHQNTRIDVSGFMAPPLKANASFFVLTRRPMAVCPFCDSAADWPDDIIAVYTKRPVDVVYYTIELVTNGRLELGEYRDPDTGFVSMARLVDATYSQS